MAHFPEFDPAAASEGRARSDSHLGESELHPLLFDQLNFGVVVVAPDGRLLLANAWMRSFFEPFTADRVQPDGTVVDRSRLSRPDGSPVPPGMLPLERSMATGKPVAVEELLFHSPAGDRYIAVDAVPIVAGGGEIVAYSASTYNLTELHTFLDQIGEIQRELDAHMTELGRMHSLIERLSSRVELPELLADTLDVVAEFNDADTVTIFLADSLSGELIPAASRGVSEDERKVLADVPRQAMFTALRAMKGLSTAIVDIASEPELPAAYRDCLMGIGVVSVHSMPLRSADNTVLGAIVSMFRRVRMPTAHQKALLDTAGRIVAQLIVNARSRARDHGVAAALQRSMLQVRLPQPPDCELAARYQAGTNDLRAGGDWYEASALGGGRIGLTIGDVIGHGVEAVGMMGQLRSALTAFTLAGGDGDDGGGRPEPAQMVRQLDRWVNATGLGEASTVCAAVVDPATGEGVLSSAGHPAPLLITADGAAYLHDSALGAPLGLLSVGAGNAPEQVRFAMPPGSVLLLYTDGLIERRGEHIQTGLDRLAEVARGILFGTAEGDLNGACRRLLEVCAPIDRTIDDIAVLAFRFRRPE